MRNDLNPETRTTTTPLGTGWHTVELCGSTSGTSVWTLYHDRILINTWTTNTGTTPVGIVQLGMATSGTFTANFDHFVVDQAPSDPGAPADTNPPTVPGTPTGTSTTTSTITLNWPASTDPSTPITYRIFRDGGATQVGTSNTTSYTDTGLAAGSNHSYTVAAVDAAGNASAKSAVLGHHHGAGDPGRRHRRLHQRQLLRLDQQHPADHRQHDRQRVATQRPREPRRPDRIRHSHPAVGAARNCASA